MSRAVVSKHVPQPQNTSIDDASRPKRKHIMAGAEVPPIPDKDRPRHLVLRDHAIAVWGELRGVSELDSAKATEVLAAAMERLLNAVRDEGPAIRNRIVQLEKAGSYVMGKLKQATSRPPRGDEEKDSRRRCVVCNRPVMEHTVDCPVRKGFERGKSVGFTVGVEE